MVDSFKRFFTRKRIARLVLFSSVVAVICAIIFAVIGPGAARLPWIALGIVSAVGTVQSAIDLKEDRPG